MRRLYLALGLVWVFLLLLPLFLDKYLLGILVMVFYYAYLGQAWNVLTGYTGHVSLGHALYVGIGAYTTTFLAQNLGISPWLGMWAGAFLASGVGLCVGFLGFRFGLRGVYFVILTIAFAEMGRLVVSHLEVLGSFTGIFVDFRPGFWNMQFRGNLPYYYISLGMLTGACLLVRVLELSRLGRLMVAVREDETAAAATGVDTLGCSLAAMGISAFLTALAGAFYANYIFYLQPNTLFGMGLSIELILRPIIGGVGTVLGPVLGSFLLTPMAELSRAYLARGGLEGLHLVLYGVLTIVVVLFMRRGILYYLQRWLGRRLGQKEDGK